MQHDGYTLLVVEFDDQGLAYEAAQMRAMQAELGRLQGLNAIILVFVHGWKHNARPLDPNLASFELILQQTARAEQAARPEDRRPVLGVFVGWRGLSCYAGWLTNLTFWNRKTAALRVALGSVRELFGRLRNHRRNNPGSVLIVAGHSFGGLVVFSALAQSLIEIATFDTATRTEPSFANLVLLVNPAFEAVRYLPIHLLVDGRQFQRQPPVLVSVTAKNDDATGKLFKFGARLGSFYEHTRNRMQRKALIHTMGHLDWMRTHSLIAEPGRGHAEIRPCRTRAGRQRDRRRVCAPSGTRQTLPTRSGGRVGAALPGRRDPDPSGETSEQSILGRPGQPEVINGHNGIFGDVFLGFVRKLVAEQLR